jgi:hypothetical protein
MTAGARPAYQLDGDRAPTIVAIAMGYGHLRPAHAIASYLGLEVLKADQPPLADADEQRDWNRTRTVYDTVSRVSGTPLVGTPFKLLLDSVTSIPPLYPFRDLSHPNLPAHLLTYTARQGLGRTMVAYLEEHDSPLLTTFYSPAVFADYHGYDRIYCVVTDSDVQRVWAPADPRQSKIHYFAPSGRVVRRLRAYGVNKDQIDFTGFPLPHTLLGGPSFDILHRNLLSRLRRLDPRDVFHKQYARELEPLGSPPDAAEPPRITFAVGGAGAQADLPGQFLPSLAALLRADRLRLTLVAGVRSDVARTFEQQLDSVHLGNMIGRSVEILHEPDVYDYFDRFNALLARTDVLWTKPSELTFFGGLGLPLLFSPPVGRHETYNLRWALENGAGLTQRKPRFTAEWLNEWLVDGTLAATAWAGYKRLPHRGLYRIVEHLGDTQRWPRNTVAPPPS